MRRPRSRTPWLDRVRALGLEVAAEDEDGGLTLRHAAAQGLVVHVARVGRSDGWEWHITARHPDAPRDLRLVPESSAHRVRKLFVGEDILTGDPDFDETVYIAGDEVATLGLLTAAVRDQIRALVEQGRVEGGAVEWRERSDEAQPVALLARIGWLMRLARTLAVQTDRFGRLLRMARTDRRAECRLRALEVYLRHGGQLDEHARRHLLRDDDARVRLRVARICAAVDALVALASNADPAVRRDALDALVGQAGDRVAAAFAAAAGDAPVIALRGLLPCLDAEPALIDDLGEAALVVLLDGGRRWRGEAADRLGAIGTEAAIAPLARLAETFFGGSEDKARARAAITAITTRLGGLRAGGLTVVDVAPGALSTVTPPDQ